MVLDEAVGIHFARERRFLAGARALRRFIRRKPLGALGAFIILALGVIAIFAPQIAPFPFDEVHRGLENSQQGPSRTYIFGTDALGRDIFSRIIFGTRITLRVSMATMALGVGGGLVIGIVSGFLGGWVDLIVQRFVDGVMAFPALVLLLLLASAFPPSEQLLIFSLAFLTLGPVSRVVRGEALSKSQEVYVEAARAIGASPARIMFRHILPNIAPILIVYFSTGLGAVILAASGLSFLGLGIPPPAPEWGRILSEGRIFAAASPHLVIFPGAAIAITVLAFNLLGDAMRDVLDPRLRAA